MVTIELDDVESDDICQEIGLVALMFFFELLFSYVSVINTASYLKDITHLPRNFMT